jgi:hypothetical protein
LRKGCAGKGYGRDPLLNTGDKGKAGQAGLSRSCPIGDFWGWTTREIADPATTQSNTGSFHPISTLKSSGPAGRSILAIGTEIFEQIRACLALFCRNRQAKVLASWMEGSNRHRGRASQLAVRPISAMISSSQMLPFERLIEDVQSCGAHEELPGVFGRPVADLFPLGAKDEREISGTAGHRGRARG